MKRRPKGQKRPLYRKEGDLRGSDTIDGNVTSQSASEADVGFGYLLATAGQKGQMGHTKGHK